ncbi:MAG: hypothetical protein ACYC9N_18805 [Thermoanaerobaculia bacterium]
MSDCGTSHGESDVTKARFALPLLRRGTDPVGSAPEGPATSTRGRSGMMSLSPMMSPSGLKRMRTGIFNPAGTPAPEGSEFPSYGLKANGLNAAVIVTVWLAPAWMVK